MQRRDKVEVLFAGLIVEQDLALDHRFDGLAFEHAVLTYQLRNPGAGVETARRAVAMIICSKP